MNALIPPPRGARTTSGNGSGEGRFSPLRVQQQGAFLAQPGVSPANHSIQASLG